MKIKFLFFLPVLFLGLLIAGCDTVQQSSYEDTGVGGVVFDSATHSPVQNAEIILLPDGIRTFSDSAGNFYIGKIHVPTSAGNYELWAFKTGYDTIKRPIILYAGDTTARYNLVLFTSEQDVYVNYSVYVYGFQNSNSLSSVDLYNLISIQDTNTIVRDLRLRDSAGTKQVYWLLSGRDYTSGYGWHTKFTEFIGYYDHDQFASLASLFGGRPLNSDSDFPYDLTNSFSVPSLTNMVFGYYLKGRQDYGGGPKIYGLIRIADVYYDTGLNNTVVVLDLKMNRKGNNYFLLN